MGLSVCGGSPVFVAFLGKPKATLLGVGSVLFGVSRSCLWFRQTEGTPTFLGGRTRMVCFQPIAQPQVLAMGRRLKYESPGRLAWALEKKYFSSTYIYIYMYT